VGGYALQFQTKLNKSGGDIWCQFNIWPSCP